MSPDRTAAAAPAWDTGSTEDFFKYYEQQSLSPATLERFRQTTEIVLRLFAQSEAPRSLDVLDVGCGAGTQGRHWLERGHRYHGIDINAPLIGLAQRRAAAEGLAAHFDVGSATALPHADRSMDVVVLPEILEHVADWQGVLAEAVRVLRPGGLLFATTSSRLCPRQDEFDLPLYSWYPAVLKRRYERLAVTTRPELVNHATYPAVNWFSYYQLRDHLAASGFTSRDRFDIMDTAAKGPAVRWLVRLLRAVPPLRFVGHVLTPYTLVVARRGR